MFTVNTYLESWLTKKADVVAQIGGKYELFWEPENPEDNSTIGCKILALEKPVYINFEWKGPKQYKHFMNNANPLTNVNILFNSVGDHTNVVLLHTGWRDSEEWEEAKQYFINAWEGAFEKLKDFVHSSNEK